ncbi:MAG TPA: DegT/DnrJ/EryC1/StrS aminotransferase family protein, partial [Pseudomonas sp.]|nr:DegT/DnrJ/EryC1/StrS aminotransferase family protein [Pseudomonas sp.]
GSLSTFSVFSFHGTKVMTTGEGGMLATADAALARRVEQLNNHGRAAGDMRQFWPSELGHKYKMSNLQAALGCAQLERLEEMVQRKREIFRFYRDHLLDALPGTRMNPEPEGCRNSYWMPTLVLPRNAPVALPHILEHMRLQGIDARVFFQPLSDTPVFAGLSNSPTPLAHDLATRAFNLPSYHDMSLEDQQRVVAVVIDAVRGKPGVSS